MSHQDRVDRNLTFRSLMTDAVTAHRKAGSIGTKMLKLARRSDDVEHFMTQCQEQEDWVLSDEAGQMKEAELPKCWTQAKSDIKQAWKAGVDPHKVTSYHKMREAKTQINKDKRSANNGASGRGEGGGVKQGAAVVTSVEEALEDGSVVDAKSNMIVPEELLPLVRLLNKMSQHGRARAIKKFTDQAQSMLDGETATQAQSMRARMDKASG